MMIIRRGIGQTPTTERSLASLRMFWLVAAGLSLFKIWDLYRQNVWPLDDTGHLRLYDFATFWAAGKRVLSGQSELIYDPRTHEAFEAMLAGQPQERWLNFPYPPTALPFVWPLGLFDYPTAWLLFVAVGAAVWFMVLRRITKDNLIALGMTFAIGGSTHCLLLGQNGFLTASLVCGAMLLLPTRKALAGVAIGLLSLKPHLAATAFAALLIWHEWRALGFALGTVAALAALTTVLFGTAIWPAFLAGSAAFSEHVLAGQETLLKPLVQSVLALALPTAGMTGAAAAQGLAAILALVSLFSLKRPSHRAAGLTAAAVLVTPFSFLYDFTMLMGGCAFLLRDARSTREIAIIAVVSLIPGLWYATQGAFGAFAALLVLALVCFQAARNDLRSDPLEQPTAT